MAKNWEKVLGLRVKSRGWQKRSNRKFVSVTMGQAFCSSIVNKAHISSFTELSYNLWAKDHNAKVGTKRYLKKPNFKSNMPISIFHKHPSF